ncbi:chromosome condensation protein CrcB [Actinophytocola xinjiangensis]|uniref:Fluoride-specific ion channel FluC n=1 Tax=Actinophytocola xinjiangensis TaxID=485602 RepID=A0A7Z1AW14_9PSEU|nr:CrcB family protein [Actinophytocola xinjiangensis]OLF08056.1 chromosome condensation protein CrcB [Actinophytocola xinjiangensis]
MDPKPVDPDVDLHVPAQRRELTHHHLSVLGVIAAGGGLGALARHGLAQALPTAPRGFPWHTLIANVAGCLLIGVLMVVITEVITAHRLVRPFLGVGVLGGFTTFSTYASEIRALLAPGTVALAFLYLAGTLVAALLAVVAGMAGTRALVGGR